MISTIRIATIVAHTASSERFRYQGAGGRFRFGEARVVR